MPHRHVRVNHSSELAEALDGLGLLADRPVLAVVGGAAGLDRADVEAIRNLLLVVVPVLEQWGVSVVDGGTLSGVMQLMGEVREQTAGTFPLVGVTAIGTITASGASADSFAEGVLEPRHTHIVLVPGNEWGDESPWLAAVTTLLAGGESSATLVLNGGDITYQDMQRSLQLGRPLIVVAGTGRAADAVALAKAGEQGGDLRAASVAASPLAHVASLTSPLGVLTALASVLPLTELGKRRGLAPDARNG